jgi:hypothetical protein
MELNHQIFGKINYNYGWTQDITVTIFGKKSVLEVNIDADADGEFEVNQERAYIFFKEHLDEIIKESNAAIVSYYNSEIADIVSDYANVGEKQYFLDKIGDEEQIYSLLKPKQIMFPLTFDEHVEEFGFICDCDWDKENGVGIKFTNGILSEIGSQDILL